VLVRHRLTANFAPMRAFFVLGFLAYAFDSDELNVASPTDDPEESNMQLLDEYSSDSEPALRFLQTLVNASNSSIDTPTEDSGSIPWIPLALVGLGGAGAAGYFMTREGTTYETTYEEYADDGLLDEEYEEYEEYEFDEEEYYE